MINTLFTSVLLTHEPASSAHTTKKSAPMRTTATPGTAVAPNSIQTLLKALRLA